MMISHTASVLQGMCSGMDSGIVAAEAIGAGVEEKWNKRALKQPPLQPACLCAGGSGFPGFNELQKQREFCQNPFAPVATEECLWASEKSAISELEIFLWDLL